MGEREKASIEEEGDDDNEVQEALRKLQNSIDDEKNTIQQLQEEMAPNRQMEEDVLLKLSGVKKKLMTVEQEAGAARDRFERMKNDFQAEMDRLKLMRAQIVKIPPVIEKLERELAQNQQSEQAAQEQIEALKQRALEG